MNQEGLNSLGGNKNKVIISSIVALLLCCIAIFIFSVVNYDVPVSEQNENYNQEENAYYSNKDSKTDIINYYPDNHQEDISPSTQSGVQSNVQSGNQVNPQDNINNQAVTNSKCRDSDGGKDYYKRGSVYMYNAPEVLSNGTSRGSIFGENINGCTMRMAEGYQDILAYDCCVNSNTSNAIHEAYCDENGEENFVSYTCPNGCKDGACAQ